MKGKFLLILLLVGLLQSYAQVVHPVVPISPNPGSVAESLDNRITEEKIIDYLKKGYSTDEIIVICESKDNFQIGCSDYFIQVIRELGADEKLVGYLVNRKDIILEAEKTVFLGGTIAIFTIIFIFGIIWKVNKGE